jgi:ketosteroid isomerase-like protein
MKNFFCSYFTGRAWQGFAALVLGMAVFFATAVPSVAQQKEKKKKNAPADNTPIVPVGDEQQIDNLISDMLGAWQIGDTDKLRKDYADDVSVVNGMWAPPVFGWTNYLAAYQQQRARMQQVRMDRLNTYYRVNGNFAWACYQWDFSAVVDGQPSAARGQTTLIFEKRNDHWLIVHNHTSLAQTSQPATPANTPQIAQPQPNRPSSQ